MKGLYNPTPVDALPVDAALAKAISSDWAYDHAADLDAHHYDRFLKFRTGVYYANFGRDYVDVTLEANKLYGTPLVIVRAMTFDYVMLEVNTTGGTVIRIGIYNDGTNLYPGTRKADFGTVASNTTGVKTIDLTSSKLSLPAGFYWLAIISDGTPIVRTNKNHVPYLGIRTTDVSNMEESWSVAQTYGVLPDPFTAGGAVGGNPLLPYLRVYSLD